MWAYASIAGMSMLHCTLARAWLKMSFPHIFNIRIENIVIKNRKCSSEAGNATKHDYLFWQTKKIIYWNLSIVGSFSFLLFFLNIRNKLINNYHVKNQYNKRSNNVNNVSLAIVYAHGVRVQRRPFIFVSEEQGISICWPRACQTTK